MQEPSSLFVVLMGVATVFICLISIIILIKLLGFIVIRFKGNEPDQANQTPVPAAKTVPATPAPSTNRQQVIAAISAAISEDMGGNVPGIRIHSIKKL